MNKDLRFRGDSHRRIQEFSSEAKRKTGFELRKVQNGLKPSDVKQINTVGQGVQYIRVRTSDGIYRIIFYAQYIDTVYVLHAFKKKTQRIPTQDIDTAKSRFRELQNERKDG